MDSRSDLTPFSDNEATDPLQQLIAASTTSSSPEQSRPSTPSGSASPYEPLSPVAPFPAENEYEKATATILSIPDAVLLEVSFNYLSHCDKYPPQSQMPQQPVTPFTSCAIPSIPIDAYARRFIDHVNVPPRVFAVAIMYLIHYSLLKKDKIQPLNVHRLLATALTLAMKFHQDGKLHYNNKTMAILAGIPTSELNQLEVFFLGAVQFDLEIKPTQFLKYYEYLVELDKLVKLEREIEKSSHKLGQSQAQKANFNSPSSSSRHPFWDPPYNPLFREDSKTKNCGADRIRWKPGI